MKGLNDHFKEYRSGYVAKEILRIESLLNDYARWSTCQEDIKAYKALEAQHNNLVQVEEVIWRQKSRVVWLNMVIEIHIFFHGKVDKRRRTTSIKKPRDENGVL